MKLRIRNLNFGAQSVTGFDSFYLMYDSYDVSHINHLNISNMHCFTLLYLCLPCIFPAELREENKYLHYDFFLFCSKLRGIERKWTLTIQSVLFVWVRQLRFSSFFFFVSFHSSELFRSPIRTTQCGHNFCEKCLNDIFANGHLGRWACPECRQEHDCPVNSLPRCFLIEKMVEKVKKQSQASSKCEFGSCSKHSRMIEYREFNRKVYIFNR